MSPRAQRQEPLHRQIFDHYKQRILDGELQPGEPLQSIRATAEEWGVGQQAAQRAYELLRSAKLVTTSQRGTVVAERRTAYGPQQRLQLARYSPGELIRVTAAGRTGPVPGYEYVWPILGIGRPGQDGLVIRREQLVSDGDGPLMLMVTWVPASWAGIVPELLETAPLPDPRGAAHLIADRADITAELRRVAFEARPPMDDDREIPLLGMVPGEYVLGYVWQWGYEGAGELLAYEEAAVRPNRVIEFDIGA